MSCWSGDQQRREKNPDGTYTYHKQQGTAAGASIDVSGINPPISNFMHNHYKGLLSVFSGSDLAVMYNWMKNDKMDDPSKFSMSLVTANGTTYMLQIDDIKKFQNFGKTWLVNATWFTVFETFYDQKYGISQTASNSANLSGFLRLLSDYNSVLKFFVGDTTSFSTWTPKKFESDGTLTGGTVIDSPCN